MNQKCCSDRTDKKLEAIFSVDFFNLFYYFNYLINIQAVIQRQTEIWYLNFSNVGEGVIIVDHALWSLMLLPLIGTPGHNWSICEWKVIKITMGFAACCWGGGGQNSSRWRLAHILLPLRSLISDVLLLTWTSLLIKSRTLVDKDKTV